MASKKRNSITSASSTTSARGAFATSANSSRGPASSRLTSEPRLARSLSHLFSHPQLSRLASFGQNFYYRFSKLPTHLYHSLKTSITFVILISIFSLFVVAEILIPKGWTVLRPLRIIPDSLKRLFTRASSFLDRDNHNGPSRAYLIELAFKHMQAKRTRTLITVFGMSISMAFIVLLMSIGYGLQHLVTTRVARLEELQQAEVLPGLSDDLVLNDKFLSRVQNLPEVKAVLPLISVVGRVSFQDSISDIAVYGTTTDYLASSAIQPIRGKVFQSQEMSRPTGDGVVEVNREGGAGASGSAGAGASDDLDDEGKAVSFIISEGSWLRVRSDSSVNGQVLGYTRQANIGNRTNGYEVWGDYYQGFVLSNGGSSQGGSAFDNSPDNSSTNSSQNQPNKALWIKATFPLWQSSTCTDVEPSQQQPAESDSSDVEAKTDPDGATDTTSTQPAASLTYNKNCEDGQYIPLLDELGNQAVKEGFVAQLPGQITVSSGTNVLGVSTVAFATSSSSLNQTNTSQWLAQGGTLPVIDQKDTLDSKVSDEFATNIGKTIIQIPKGSLRQAVVNRSVLSLLGLSEDKAVGSKITMTFIAVSSQSNGEEERIESAPTTYEIIGVTPEDDTPVVYVPFIELRSLGIDNFSQVKVVAKDKNLLSELRATIETMGYGTVSVADTVTQIDNLFGNFRLLMAVIGLVALFVASLGMFNTLTVSLLERTREIGLLKAMGMRSDEIRELFLTESMIMGFYGGVLGLIIGSALGKLLSLVLTGVAVSHGVGSIDISLVPFDFVLVVVGLSVVVGIITGFFPARRATKISALNALRYE